MRRATTTPKQFVTLGMTLSPERAKQFRDIAWQQRITVAGLLRELVTEALTQRGIDFSASESAMPETTHAPA